MNLTDLYDWREFTISQQTPMIHFHHAQKQVCLRASDVKPRLDAFIAGQLGGWQNIPLKWKIGEHEALNYIMRIKADHPYTLVKSMPKTYFGNVSISKSQPAGPVMLSNIKLSIKVPRKISSLLNISHPCNTHQKEMGLFDTICMYLPYFFMLNNFGTRGSKGLGSFKIDDDGFEIDVIKHFFPTFYYIKYNDKQGYEDILDDVWVISNMMKSGFNLTKANQSDYYKGRLIKHFIKKGIGSDKAFIKHKILKYPKSKDVNKQSEDYKSYKEYRFIRAMLGLAPEYSFSSPRNGKVKVSHDTIERFASPILFKPHDNILLILPHCIPDAMFDTCFTFSKTKLIKTPSKDEFDLITYLDEFASEFNRQNDIKAFRNCTVKKTIKKSLSIQKAIMSLPNEKGGEVHV